MTTDFWLWNFLDLDPGPRGPVLFPRVMTTAHCIRNNFSMRSCDCTSELIPVLFEGHSSADEYASKITKTIAIINGKMKTER